MTTNKYPTLKVEIGFTGDRLDPSAVVWTDVTQYVRRDPPVEIHRGRSSELDTFTPGEAIVTLNNRARRFDPRFAAGPYYGNLVPGRPIRITFSGTWTLGTITGAQEYYGFIDSWPQSYSDGNVDATVTIHAYDLLTELGKLTQPDPVYEYTLSTIGSCELFLRNFDGSTWFDESGNARHATKSADVAHAASTFGYTVLKKNPGRFVPVVIGGFINNAQPSGVNGTSVVSSSLAAGLTSPSVTGGRFSLPSTVTLGTHYSVALWFTTSSPGTAFAAGQTVQVLGSEGGTAVGVTIAPKIAINGVDQGDGVTITATGPGIGGAQIGDGYNVADGHAHHLVFSCAATLLSIYYDGALVSTSTGTATTTTIGAIDLDQYVYSLSVPYGQSLLSPAVSTTAVQDITAWSKALSAGEALTLYEYGLGQVSESPLLRGDRLLENVGVPIALLQAPDPGVGTCLEYLPAFQSTLDQLNLVAATEGGYLYADSGGGLVIQSRYHLWVDDSGIDTLMTITDDRTSSTGVPYRQVATDYSAAREVRNDVTVTATGGTVGTATDATSISTYGQQSTTISTVLPSTTEAASLAALQLGWHKDPTTRLSAPVELLPVRNPDTWFNVVFAEIGYRVTFELMPGRVPPRISQQMEIEGISWEIGEEWNLSLDLAPIPGDGVAASSPWILGDPTYGVLGTARLGY